MAVIAPIDLTLTPVNVFLDGMDTIVKLVSGLHVHHDFLSFINNFYDKDDTFLCFKMIDVEHSIISQMVWWIKNF